MAEQDNVRIARAVTRGTLMTPRGHRAVSGCEATSVILHGSRAIYAPRQWHAFLSEAGVTTLRSYVLGNRPHKTRVFRRCAMEGRAACSTFCL
jgi:hypothetical protein